VFKNIFGFLLVLGIGAAQVSAADQPFAGEWKLNPSKSKLVDQMKVEGLGGNKYTFDFGGGAETVVVDGTDQPGQGGTTLSVTAASDSWKVVRKKDGRELLTAIWKLSGDGKTLTDDFTSVNPNGSKTNVVYVYDRRAGGPGFAGTWVSTSQTINSVLVMRIQPYEGDGLSFISPSRGTTTNMKFDGKDYPWQGQAVSSSMRKVNERTLELTDKADGKLVQTRQLELSSDSKTLTMTVHMPGKVEPSVLVFERQ
jgi:hypothetical protein